jgi:2-polyprenyl-3-methyl-5-hydroxy-6-metoxy-1,4-benzoquinol methylase
MKQTLKRWIPRPLHPALRRLRRLVSEMLPAQTPYDTRLLTEIGVFNNSPQLPPIAQYWHERFLKPMLEPYGFTNAIELFRLRIAQICRQHSAETVAVASVGAGDCAADINVAEWLCEKGARNFSFECFDLNPELLQRAKASAERKGVGGHFQFRTCDINLWQPEHEYRVILAIQSLHHVVELDALFGRIKTALHPDGLFMTDDMIGRNGHQRWPEALQFVQELWNELPDKYKYNHSLKRFESEYENWDCSTAGFEGIRAQDVLPLLMAHFHFDTFMAFGNLIDIFIDRAFGPNFDPASEWDRAFIDRVHALDVVEIESGRLKPTHIMAVMTSAPVARTRTHKHLTPDFCVRTTRASA